MKLERVSYSYDHTIPALFDVSFEINGGDRVAIVGANGSGKSTLLQIMGGLKFPAAGRFLFGQTEVSERSLQEKGFLRLFRGSVGYVFQDSDVQLFCPTVLDELLYGPLQLEMGEEEGTKRAYEVMQMLKIEHLQDRPSHMLSEGEKKKVAIGSVLTMNPQAFLLDEPTNGLDPRTQVFLVELMLALNESGKTIVLATHDLGLVAELGARVVVLSEEHRVEKTGSADEVLGDQNLLLRVNLIHEHVHLHGKTKHAHLHSHYQFHKH
ncbi:MAG TPA: ABC transporter ATP-binding protein [Thermodesulfobacteriota bacterium]|nr:ABC transporter ATP-binding protein [Thermodesulfobacteriota bacterium]